VNTIVAIGAHQDDIELRCGGTFAKYVNDGWRGIYAVASTTPHYNPTPEERAARRYPGNAEITELRNAEARAGSEILGAGEFHFLGFKSVYWYRENTLDRAWLDGLEYRPEDYQYLMQELPGREFMVCAPMCETSIQSVADFIAGHQPQIVLTHSPDDLHWEHYVTALLALKACRKLAADGHELKLYGWEPGSSGPMTAFSPTHCVDIGDSLEVKQEALRSFPSQHRDQKGDFSDFARERAAFWGQFVGVEYAEAFVRFDLEPSADFQSHFRLVQTYDARALELGL